MSEDFHAQIKSFIAENFLFRADAVIGDDQSLLESGVMDSTGVLELIAFLESTFGIRIKDEDIVPENLDSVNRVAAYLSSQLQAA